MIEYKSGERLGFIKKAHTRKSVLVQWSCKVVMPENEWGPTIVDD